VLWELHHRDKGLVADKRNPAEAGCQLTERTSLPLRCHVGKEIKRMRKAATSLAGGACETTKTPPHAHRFISRAFETTGARSVEDNL